jgi:hypothetical protein
MAKTSSAPGSVSTVNPVVSSIPNEIGSRRMASLMTGVGAIVRVWEAVPQSRTCARQCEKQGCT